MTIQGVTAQLVALVRRFEAEGFVEAVGGGAALVGGQLHQAAAAFAALRDCPFDEGVADAAAALAAATRTPSIWPRHMPRRVRPGMKLSCNTPITCPSRSATASSWFGSRSIAAKASR